MGDLIKITPLDVLIIGTPIVLCLIGAGWVISKLWKLVR